MSKTGNKIIKARVNGERKLFLFRKEPFQPILVPFIYAILRLKSYALNTTKNHLIGIKYFYEYWELESSQDLDELLINGEIESVLKRYENFIMWLSYTNTVNSKRTNQLYNKAVVEYLKWCNLRYSSSTQYLPNQKLDDLFASFSRYIPYEGRKEEIFQASDINLLRDYCAPGNKKNPFRTQNRNRNFLITELLYATGIRIGELLKIKTRDVFRSDDNFYIRILNNENDPEDTRSNEPCLKNRQSERVISITPDLFKLIDNYIGKERKPVRNGKRMSLKHGYLFTSERGHPISKDTVNKLFGRLNERFARTKKVPLVKLTPHTFRHIFAENFLEFLIEIKGVDFERAKDELRTICGWSASSNMPSFYAKRYISRKANEHNQDRVVNAYKRTE